MLLMLLTAWSAPNTWCVGGANKCAAQRSRHPKWHHHTNVVSPNGTCYACFDEHDSSCVTGFLRQNPRWKGRIIFASCPKPNLPIRSHVIAGREVNKPKPRPKPTVAAPPEPRPVARLSLTPRITRVSGGPYAAGDTVTVYGAVFGPKGRRGVKSGVVWVTANGKTARFSARARPDGTVAVKITLPPNASSVSIRFEPTTHKLAANESLSATRSKARTLHIETCPWRATVAQPAVGTGVQIGAPLELVPKLSNISGAAPTGPIQLTWTVVPAGGDPVRIPSDARGRATWRVPADLSGQTLSISVGGRVQGANACSTGERILPVSKLGLGWNTTELPTQCGVGQPCSGTATLVLPDEPTARAAVQALLEAPDTRVVLYAGDTRTEVRPTPDHRYRFGTTSNQVGVAWFRLELVGPKGSMSVEPHPVNIVPGLQLKLPAEIDFGTVPVGTAWTDVCKPLDYSQSTSWEGHSWKLEVTGAEGCLATPVLMYANAWGQPSQASLLSPVETDPHHELRPIHDICLSTSGCSGEVQQVNLVVTPLDPAFADQVATVRLKWTLVGESWWWCWGWLLLPIPPALAFVVFLYGWFRPLRFPPHAAIRIASKPSALKRSVASTLRDIPGSGSGWYRNARLGLHHSGELNKHIKGAAVVLRAGVRDVLLDATVPLEVRNRRTGAYEAVPPGPQAALPNQIYRAGGVYFQVEV